MTPYIFVGGYQSSSQAQHLNIYCHHDISWSLAMWTSVSFLFFFYRNAALLPSNENICRRVLVMEVKLYTLGRSKHLECGVSEYRNFPARIWTGIVQYSRPVPYSTLQEVLSRIHDWKKKMSLSCVSWSCYLLATSKPECSNIEHGVHHATQSITFYKMAVFTSCRWQ
jgi:hypothetical protein